MQIYRHLDEVPVLEKPVMTLGTFDGVHLGHQKILARLKEVARVAGGEVVLLTFYPHPRKVLFPDKHDLQLINTLEEKIKMLSSQGVQHLIIHPFDEAFSHLDHETFVREILVEKLRVNTLVIGYDHQFGRNRKGSFKELTELAPILNFKVEEIPEQDIAEVAVSSTRIRKALHNGEIEIANELLGYDYSLSGKVVQGKEIGRTLGYPTANIQPDDSDKLIPANGIYAVLVDVEGQTFKGAMSIGNRPTFDNGERSVEVFLIDFNGDLYGKRLTVHFRYFLRPELKFDSVEALIAQMDKDIIRCTELL
ncbi:bifunctional riboflavin kinase/FAD synthetase [soil metagenome]